MKLRVLFSLFVIITSISLTACSVEFKEVDSDVVQERLLESEKHTAVSWWYVGKDENYYYIIEKWPTEEYGYKVSDRKLKIVGLEEEDAKLSLDKGSWVNLKISNFRFADGKSSND